MIRSPRHEERSFLAPPSKNVVSKHKRRKRVPRVPKPRKPKPLDEHRYAVARALLDNLPAQPELTGLPSRLKEAAAVLEGIAKRLRDRAFTGFALDGDSFRSNVTYEIDIATGKLTQVAGGMQPPRPLAGMHHKDLARLCATLTFEDSGTATARAANVAMGKALKRTGAKELLASALTMTHKGQWELALALQRVAWLLRQEIPAAGRGRRTVPRLAYLCELAARNGLTAMQLAKVAVDIGFAKNAKSEFERLRKHWPKRGRKSPEQSFCFPPR